MAYRNFRQYVGMLLKFLLIMIIPLAINLTSSDAMLLTISRCFLLTSLFYNGGIIPVQYTVSSVPEILLRNLFLGLLVTLPGFVYNYKIERIPLNKSYWKMGLIICFATFLETTAVLIFIVPLFTGGSPYFYSNEYYLLSSALSIYPILVMGVFVILPLIERLGISIASPLDSHRESMHEIIQVPRLETKRERRLARLLGIILCFSPFIFQIYYYYGGSFTFLSLLLYFNLNSYVISYLASNIGMAQNIAISGGITSFGMIEMLGLYSAGNFYFVREIYRYLRKEVTYRRLCLVGVLATLFPLLIPLLPFFLFQTYYYAIMIPIPSIFFFGLIITKLHRPLIEQTDKVWSDDQHDSWWKKKKEPREQEEETYSTPETPYRNNEDLVQVPLRYLIISKLKKLANRTN